MKFIVNISRLLVGSLFIVSGLIKANDPTGFSYKLEEYFSAGVLGMEWLGNYALSLALLICIAEIALGIATLLGAGMRLVSYALLLLLVFFTFLTFYSAYFNKVTDCGCFGDALKITPWQSFFKDVTLLVFVLILFVKRKSITINTFIQDIALLFLATILIAVFSFGVISWGFPVWFSLLTFIIIVSLKKFTNSQNQYNWLAFGIPILFSVLFSVYVLRHLPLRDFRPYAVGKSIPEGMRSAEDLGLEPPETIVVYTMTNKKTGETKDVSSKEYLELKIWEDKDWEITETSEPIIINPGYEPPIHDFSIISSDGADLTEEIINAPDYNFLLIAYDITKTNKKVQGKVNVLADACSKKGISFIAITASTYEDVEDFRHDVQSPYDYHTADETTLKTIIRSNPGLILLKGGVIINKWHYNDFPSLDEALKITNDE